MKNVNRDFLVTVTAKTADITSKPAEMKFYITDILTSNIFFELVPNDSSKPTRNYFKEEASNYKLTLRVVTPLNKPLETEAKPLGGNFYVADLTDEFINTLGIHQCELFIDADVTDENSYTKQERSTTEPFTYKVEKSIFTNLDDIIEGEPDYPLLIDTLATKDYVTQAIKNMDLYGFATRDYVNQLVLGGDIDFSDYVTDEDFDNALADKSDKGHKHNEYATTEYVNQLAIGGEVDLSDYVTEQELDNALAGLSSGDINLDGYVTDGELNEALSHTASATHYHNEYATFNYVDTVVSNLNISGDYVTDEELNGALESKANSEHTHDEYITDDELAAKDYASKDELPTTLPANGGNSDTVGGYSIPSSV